MNPSADSEAVDPPFSAEEIERLRPPDQLVMACGQTHQAFKNRVVATFATLTAKLAAAEAEIADLKEAQDWVEGHLENDRTFLAEHNALRAQLARYESALKRIATEPAHLGFPSDVHPSPSDIARAALAALEETP